ncbi:MAG: YebC/PmpR family DNA-binding transcriptional regulator [Bacteroidales bacterium]|nr:YebC/PmpR family DNA-binding transcriptional regulator [Bacteroidales bacterium]
MSGHNKWSTIKRKKGANDAKRSKIFSRIIKEITVAVKESGPDPDSNPRLRMAIANAKGNSMPKDNIDRAINKGKEKDGTSFAEVTYEGYAPHGIALFIECTTDNTQRTVSNIRSIFNKYGGSLGTNGSLSFLFDRKGIFVVPKGTLDQDEFEMAMIEAGAEDIELDDDKFTITTSMTDFGPMANTLEKMGIEPESEELQRIPNDTKTLDLEPALKVMKMVELFEEDDDVQNVFHNLEMTDELANAL